MKSEFDDFSSKIAGKLIDQTTPTFRSNESLSSVVTLKTCSPKKKKKTKEKHIVNLAYFFSFVEISTCSVARTRRGYVIDGD